MEKSKVTISGSRLGAAIKAENETQQSVAAFIGVSRKTVERMASPSKDTSINWNELALLSEPLKKVPYQIIQELPATYISYGWKKTATDHFEQLVSMPENCAVMNVPYLSKDHKTAKNQIRSVEIFELLRNEQSNSLLLSDRLRYNLELRQIKHEMINHPDGPQVSIWLNPVWELHIKSSHDDSIEFHWHSRNWLTLAEPDLAQFRLPDELPTITFAPGCENVVLDDDLRQRALSARPEITGSDPNKHGSWRSDEDGSTPIFSNLTQSDAKADSIRSRPLSLGIKSNESQKPEESMP